MIILSGVIGDGSGTSMSVDLDAIVLVQWGSDRTTCRFWLSGNNVAFGFMPSAEDRAMNKDGRTSLDRLRLRFP